MQDTTKKPRFVGRAGAPSVPRVGDGFVGRALPAVTRSICVTVMALGLLLVTTPPASAQTGGTLDLSWNTVDGGGGESTGGTLTLTGTAGQPDAGDLSGGTLTLKGGFWQAPSAPPPGCVSDSDCNDTDVCTFDQCLTGVCSHSPNLYGDVDHNGSVNIFDLFCILNGFGNDFSTCSFLDDDVNPCAGNGVIDIFDLFAILNAFSNVDPCCSGPSPALPSASDLTGIDRSAAPEALIRLVPDQTTIGPDEVISVDVLVSGVSDLRGYQIAVEVLDTALTRATSVKGSGVRRQAEPTGRLEPESVVIQDARADYVFGQLESFQAADEDQWRLMGALLDGSVVSEQDRYLGTFTFRASSDAGGRFRIAARSDETVLLDSAGQEIRVRPIDSPTISVR